MAKELPAIRSVPSRYRSPVADRVNLMVFLRKSLRMFRRRWWIALVTLLFGAGFGVYRATTERDVYTAMSRLSVAPKVAFSQRTGDRAIITEEKANYAQAQMEYMRGAALLSKVDEKLQEVRNPDGTTPTKTLSVAPGAGSTYIMTVNSDNLEYARRFARAWAQEFRLFKEDMLSDVARKQMDRTRYDLSRQEELVKEARAALDDYLRVHRIATSADTGTAANELLNNLQRRLQSVELERQRLEAKTAEQIADERTSGAVAGSSPAVVEDSGSVGAAARTGEAGNDLTDPLEKFMGRSNYRELRLRLRRLEAEVARQADLLKPRHPYMVSLSRGIEDVNREIKEQLVLIDDMRRAQIDSLKLEEGVLAKQIEEKRGEVAKLREISRDYQKLSEEYVGHKSQLDQLNRDYQALSKLQSNDEDFAILEDGVGPATPIGPNRVRTVVLGVTIGLLLGVGLIFLLHRLDDRVESAEDLEKALGEPVLGQIPMVSRRDSKGGLVCVDKMPENNIFVEALRGVRSSVMFGEVGTPKQVMMVTSSVPGDGKSTFTVNFAITLAKAGNKVLLVDADLRRGTVADYFGLPSSPGFSDVLSGAEPWKNVLNGVKEHKTLAVITQGREVPNPGELLLSKVIGRFLAEARGTFDYIIFDSPPVIGMDDAASLASSCDGIVFVYRVGATSLKLAKLAVNTTRQRGGEILGLILNGVSIGSPDYYYTAYYYSHYAYSEGRGRRAIAEGNGAPAHRPDGARLLESIREGGSEEPMPPKDAMLLSEDVATSEVQVLPPDEDSGRRHGKGKKG